MKINARKALALLLSLVMVLGLFAGCNEEPAETTGTPDPQPSDSQPGNVDTVKITDGIFSCAADANHVMVIRFFEDGTFYANDMMMQKAYQGKYELVDMEVTYIEAGNDYVVNWKADASGIKIEDENGKWVIMPDEELENASYKDTAGKKSVQAVKFYELDGTTPMTVNDAAAKANHYSGVDSNVIAYADGKLHNVELGGYTRTLTQDPKSDFSTEDEIRNLLYELMPEELPQWAVTFNEENPDTQLTRQDLSFKVYHNGYDDSASGLIMVSGTYTKDGEEYTLSEGGKLTMTVTDSGYSAVYTNGDTTINLVQWAEDTVSIAHQFEGSFMSGQVKLTFTLYTDGTCVLSGNGGKEVTSGTWEAGAGLPTITVDKGTAVVTATSATDVKLIWTGDIGMGSEAEYELVKVAVREVVHTFSGSAFSGAVSLVATLYSDGSVELVGNGTNVIDQGTWEAGNGLPTLTMTNGTAVVTATSATDVKLIWTGDLGTGSAADYELTKDLPKTATIVFTGSAFSGAVTLECTLWSDGTVELIGNGSNVVDKGTWEMSGAMPTVTFETGTGVVTATSATDVKLIWTGDLGTGAAADYELVKQ